MNEKHLFENKQQLLNAGALAGVTVPAQLNDFLQPLRNVLRPGAVAPRAAALQGNVLQYCACNVARVLEGAVR